MSTYDAGQASLSIVPTFKGVVAAIEKAAAEAGKQFAKTFNETLRVSLYKNLPDAPVAPATKSGSKTGGAFADAFKARVQAALKDLPQPRVGVDATYLDSELADIRARLAALGDVRVGVDLNADEALAELEALKARIAQVGADSPHIDVKVDAARAAAELEAIQAQVEALNAERVDVPVNVEDHGSAAAAETNVSGLLVAVLALGPALIPIGAAAVAGLGGIATVAAAGAAGIGVLALALSGVSKAVGLLGKEQGAAATDAAAAAKKSAASAREEASAAASLQSADEALANTRRTTAAQQVQAAEQVANARRSLGDAETQAAEQIRQADEQVATAEYGVTQANQQATEAMTALNDAREQAVRDLESYADAAVDANLNVTQSQIDLTDAQNQYAQDQASGTATALQLQQDALNVAKAQQALTEAQQQATNATADNTKAQQEGVDGAPGVVSAAQQVAQAQHDQQTAALALTDAQRNQAQVAASSAESIVKAQQAVSDAVRQEANVQAQAAYSIQTAENSVADAARRVADAQAEASQSSVSSLSKIQAQLAAMPAGTVAFAKAIRADLLPLFNQLKNVAAGGLLPGFTAALSNLKPLFQPLVAFVSGLAKTMGNLAASASKALTDPFWTQFFAYVSSTAGPTLDTFARIVGNIAKGFAGLLQAFQPITDQIGAGLVSLSAKFAAFGTGNGKGLQGFITYVQQTGPEVVATLGKVFDAIGHILAALAPIGPIVLQGIGLLASVISAIPTGVLTELAVVIGTIVVGLKLWTIAQAALDVVMDANPIALVVIAIAALAAGVIYAYTHFKTFREIVSAVFGAVKAVVSAFVSFFTTTIPHAIEDVLNFVKQHWVLLVALFTGPLGLIVIEVVKHFDAIIGFFEKLPDRILGALGDVGKLLYDAGKNIIEGLYNGLKDAAHKVTDFVGGLAHDVKHAFTHPLSILSPSKVFEGYGENIVQGLVNGIAGNATLAVHAASSLAAGVTQPFTGQVSGGDGSISPSFSSGIIGSLQPVIAAQAAIGASQHGLSSVDFYNHQPAAPYAVIAQFGTETITAMSQRVATDVVASKVTAAKQLEGANVPGSSLTHLASV